MQPKSSSSFSVRRITAEQIWRSKHERLIIVQVHSMSLSAYDISVENGWDLKTQYESKESYVVARVLVEIGALVQREHVVAAVGPVAVAAHERRGQQPPSAQRAVHGGHFEYGVAAQPVGEARHERGLALVVALVRELALHHRRKLIHE